MKYYRPDTVTFSIWICTFVLFFSGCTSPAADGWDELLRNIRGTFPHVRHISTEDLATWMQTPSTVKPIILDRRDPEEYEVSHLRGAILVRNVEEAMKKIDTEGEFRPVVVYCSVGYRSSKLAGELQSRGISKVYNLEGSIFKWANEGRPVYRDGERVHVVHPFNSVWKKFLNEKLWYHPE